jgi:hypothetical protein
MVTEFKVGHWYRWTGPKERPHRWNSYGEMDFMLDGKPHRCEVSDGYFAQLSVPLSRTWFWESGIEYIVECNPTDQLELDFQL